MKKVLVFGNSGSGKSTLARSLSTEFGLAHLDLDTLAWEPGTPPERKSLDQSRKAINGFLDQHAEWVVEGCYSDLIEMLLVASSEIVFLDLPVYLCIANARARPWEPHKYESKEAQDANLGLLVDWIAEYEQREDTFSRASHQALYESYGGKKTRYTSNRALGLGLGGSA